MGTPPYEIRVDNNRFSKTVCLSGEIDFAASLELRPKIDEITRNCKGELLLDFSQVTFIDSEGIRTLMTLFRRIHEKSARARVVSCSPCVIRVMKLVGFDQLLTTQEFAMRG